MLVPPFIGVDAMRACGEITTPDGFVKANDFYQTERYPEVFAAGAAVAVAPVGRTLVPCGVPITGYLSERMAKIVADNVAAFVRGEALTKNPPGRMKSRWVLDAGDAGMILTVEQLPAPSKHDWLLPGSEAHWAKLALEKYFMTRHCLGSA